MFSKLGILVKIDFTPFEFPTCFLRRVFDLLPLLNLPGRSVIPCYCLMLGQTRARLSPPPAFFSLPALMQARRRDRQSGKKRKIDSLDEIKFSSQMTVSPSCLGGPAAECQTYSLTGVTNFRAGSSNKEWITK